MNTQTTEKWAYGWQHHRGTSTYEHYTSVKTRKHDPDDLLVGARREVRIRVVATLNKTQQWPTWVRVLESGVRGSQQKKKSVETHRDADIEIRAGTRGIGLESESSGVGERGIVDELGSSVTQILGNVTKDVVVRVENLNDTTVGDLNRWWNSRRTGTADGRA